VAVFRSGFLGALEDAWVGFESVARAFFRLDRDPCFFVSFSFFSRREKKMKRKKKSEKKKDFLYPERISWKRRNARKGRAAPFPVRSFLFPRRQRVRRG
jgi:hypothetical protein